MTQNKIKFTGDRHNATFRHEIYLLNGKVLDGYSKHINHDEPKDPEKCLVGVASRLITNGYLSKGYYIAFYKNGKTGKDRDEQLLELTPSSYKAHNDALMFFDLQNYLNSVYEKLVSGEEIKEVKPVSRRSFSPDLFKISGQFKTHEELVKYCEGLKNKGVPYGRLQGYYYAYLREYPLNAISTQEPFPDTPTGNSMGMIEDKLGHMVVPRKN